METLVERCALGAHEQQPELCLSRQAEYLQLDLKISERERRSPGFSRALRAIRRYGNSDTVKFKRQHAVKLIAFDATAAWLAPLALACFNGSRAGARCTVLAPHGALRSSAMFSSAATFVPAHVSGARDGAVKYAIIVDGMIESVSEVDRLMRHAAKSSERSIIMCRAASDDVKRTIGINDAQRLVSISLLEFPLAETSVNALGDACAALGATFHDVMSTGHMWSTRDFDDVTRSAAMLRDGTLLIATPQPAIEIRRSSALEMLATSTTSTAAELAQRRLATLGRSITVTFAGGYTQDLHAHVLVTMLLLLDDAARHGVVVTPDGLVHPGGAYQAAASFLTSLKPL